MRVRLAVPARDVTTAAEASLIAYRGLDNRGLNVPTTTSREEERSEASLRRAVQRLQRSFRRRHPNYRAQKADQWRTTVLLDLNRRVDRADS